MPNHWNSFTEKQVAVLSVLSGMVVTFLVVFVLLPIGNFILSFVNAAFFWLTQAIVLGVVRLFSSRAAVISGVAITLTLTLYFILFSIWLFSHSHPEALAWLGYIFSLPGAIVGTLMGIWLIKRGDFENAFTIANTSALCSLVGLAFNQTIICNSVMHCGF